MIKVAEPQKNPGIELIDKLLRAHRESDRESMSHASVAAMVQNQNMHLHNAHRHNAQVDAMLKARYAECGQEGVYNPPEMPEDMATLINCTFNSEEAVRNVTKSISDIGSPGGQAPPPPPPAPPAKKNGWWKLLAAVALGAALTGGAMYLASLWADKGQQEIIALPFEPSPPA